MLGFDVVWGNKNGLFLAHHRFFSYLCTDIVVWKYRHKMSNKG